VAGRKIKKKEDQLHPAVILLTLVFTFSTLVSKNYLSVLKLSNVSLLRGLTIFFFFFSDKYNPTRSRCLAALSI